MTGDRDATPETPAAAHVVEDQSAVARLLGDPATYGPSVRRVERIDTHGAMVFLAGARVYKVKRAVRFPYMDFSTLARRRRFCEREVELNRRTAPELYLGVGAVRRAADGRLSLEGPGQAVEWLVIMRRFDQAALGDRLARAGRLTPVLMTALAEAIAAFHDAAEPLSGRAAAGGGAAGARAVVEETEQELAERPDLFDPARLADYAAAARAALDGLAGLLDARLAGGLVRRCHGDLHLRNVCVLDGRPLLFDAIEFNDALSCIDVLYDLAFLLMDLEHRDLPPFANLVLNRYLQRRDELSGLAALPLFLSMRAAVRAKVGVSAAASQPDKAAAAGLLEEARAYFAAACAYLAPTPPRLIGLGGLSGTGKTSLARALAPGIGAAPGAIHLRSDVLRKARRGLDELTRLPPEAYRAEETARVYVELAQRAASALAAGRTVIVDAVYAQPAERAALEAVARDQGVPFTGLWLEAPAETLLARVGARRGDASDATPEVVRRQLGYDLGPLTWQRVDAAGPPESVAAAARALLAAPPAYG